MGVSFKKNCSFQRVGFNMEKDIELIYNISSKREGVCCNFCSQTETLRIQKGQRTESSETEFYGLSTLNVVYDTSPQFF